MFTFLVRDSVIRSVIYLISDSDYQDMRLFGIERGKKQEDLLSLPSGIPSEDTFERVFKSICPDELEKLRSDRP